MRLAGRFRALAGRGRLLTGAGTRAFGTLTVAVVAVIGCSSALAASATAAAAQTLVWRACPYPGVPAALQCATLTVPIDYAHPGRGSTHVVIDRLPPLTPRTGWAASWSTRVARRLGHPVRRA